MLKMTKKEADHFREEVWKIQGYFTAIERVYHPTGSVADEIDELIGLLIGLSSAVEDDASADRSSILGKLPLEEVCDLYDIDEDIMSRLMG